MVTAAGPDHQNLGHPFSKYCQYIITRNLKIDGHEIVKRPNSELRSSVWRGLKIWIKGGVNPIVNSNKVEFEIYPKINK